MSSAPGMSFSLSRYWHTGGVKAQGKLARAGEEIGALLDHIAIGGPVVRRPVLGEVPELQRVGHEMVLRVRRGLTDSGRTHDCRNREYQRQLCFHRTLSATRCRR